MSSASLFNVKTLTSFQELYPFFNALATQHEKTKCSLKVLSHTISHISNETIEGESEVRKRNIL